MKNVIHKIKVFIRWIFRPVTVVVRYGRVIFINKNKICKN